MRHRKVGCFWEGHTRPMSRANFSAFFVLLACLAVPAPAAISQSTSNPDAAGAAIRAIGLNYTLIDEAKAKFGIPIEESDTSAHFGIGGYSVLVDHHSKTLNTWPYPRGSIHRITFIADRQKSAQARTLEIDGPWNASECADDQKPADCAPMFATTGLGIKQLGEFLLRQELCAPDIVAIGGRSFFALHCDNGAGEGAVMLYLRTDSATLERAGIDETALRAAFTPGAKLDWLAVAGSLTPTRLETWIFGDHDSDPARFTGVLEP